MSLVIGVVHKNFVVLGGEGKATLNNGQILEDFQKVFKISNSALIGITGTLQGINDFVGFMFNIADARFYIKQFHPKPTYYEIKQLLDNRYDEILNNGNCDNFFVAIAGWDGNEFCIDSYFYNSTDPTSNKRTHLTPQPDQDFKCVCLENCSPKHFNDFLGFGKKMTEANILQIKNAIKNTIDVGTHYDQSINKTYSFVSIRKRDLSNN